MADNVPKSGQTARKSLKNLQKMLKNRKSRSLATEAEYTEYADYMDYANYADLVLDCRGFNQPRTQPLDQLMIIEHFFVPS